MSHALRTPAPARAREHRWAIALLAYPLAERTKEGWRAMPPAVRRRWVVLMLVGFAVGAAVCAGLTVWAMRLEPQGTWEWEREWLLALPDRIPLNYHDAVWLGAIGSTAMLVPVVFTASILLALRRQVLPALALLAGYFLAKPLIFTGWWIWDRPRPDFIENAAAVPGGLQSFPSGHVLQTVAVYGLLCWLWARRSRSVPEQVLIWALFAFLTLTQAVSRLRIGAHWPSDVVAALVVGAVWCIWVAWATDRAEREAVTRDA